MKVKETQEYKKLKNKYDISKSYSDKIEKRLNVLEQQVKRFKQEKIKQNEKIKKELAKSREIEARDVLIKQMHIELKKQKNISNLYNSHIQRDQEFDAIKASRKIPVIIINNFIENEITMAHREHGLRNQVLYFRNFDYSLPALKALINFGPKAILNIDKRYTTVLKKHNITAKQLEPHMHTYFGSILPKDLE